MSVLLEMTEENLETGLRGVPVGYCVTSKVDPQLGLFYGDYPISEAGYWNPERVIFLLRTGRDGSEEQIENFKRELQAHGSLDRRVVEHIRTLPREGHPMQLLSSALLTLGMFELRGDYRIDCLNLIAKLPELVAHVINHHAGWGETPKSEPERGYMENFTHMLNVPGKRDEELERVFKLLNVLQYDHGGGNLSVFVGKAIASSLEDLYGSLSGAMCALAGPRHGRANQACLEFVKEVSETVGDTPTGDAVEALLREKLANKELVYGFGHAVLRVEDPRATIQYEMAEKYYKDHPLVKIAFLLRERGVKVLKENPKVANPYPNVDAISGALTTAAGFPYPEYYTVLFGLSRCVGIAIQIEYERCQARGGKGTPIVRPKYIYKGRS